MSHYSKTQIEKLLKSNNHYQTLGVTSSASQKEIKAAFKAKALKYHPDKTTIPQAKDLFSKVANAYQHLSDPEEKAKYDADLARQKSARPSAQPFKREEPKYKKYQSQQRKQPKKPTSSEFRTHQNEQHRQQFKPAAKSYNYKKPQPRANNQHYQQYQKKPYKPKPAQRNKNNFLGFLLLISTFLIFWTIVPSYSTQPRYQFVHSSPFDQKMKTSRYKVNYWVRPADANKTRIYEERIELNYIALLEKQCDRNLKLKQRALAMQADTFNKDYWKQKLAAVSYKACKKLLKMVKKYPLIQLEKFPNLN